MRHTIIPAVYLILKNEKGEICLMRRFQTGYMNGYFSLPAGHLEGGESLVQAMIREAKEEIDIQINSSDLRLVHVCNNLACDPERIDFFFGCTNWSGQLKNNEPDKCDQVLWVKISDLPENIVPVVKMALTSSLDKNLNYSEYWGE